MTLWTPDGEVPVNRDANAHARDHAHDHGHDHDHSLSAEAMAAAGIPDFDDLSPEDRERAEKMVAEMAEVQAQIAAAPAAQVLANHVIGIYELAAIHLSQEQPKLAEARLAIDALAAVLDAIGDSLEAVAPGLRGALTQVQMAYVQRQGDTDSAD